MVKGSSLSRVRVNASATKEEEDGSENVQPEDFDVDSHQHLLMEGMNQLRLKEHLLDVKLKAEGKIFQVSISLIQLICGCT